jgi:hypothetical protein
MKKKREHDPELEILLQAFREVHPTSVEKDAWKAAIANELKELNPPMTRAAAPSVESPRSRVYRFVIRTAIQVGVAASLGFVIGAYIVERRYDQGQTMLFSQLEPSTMIGRPATIDETREVIHVHLDSGVSE